MAATKHLGLRRLRKALVGRARSVYDRAVFHKLTLAAFMAWVGLGSDGLSSSCYGPAEAFLALQGHHYLGVFVALATALTIFVISTSYSQIIELFPTGGGGYLVASKLLSPRAGAVAGCALLVDYVLTIAISISSGADALFSFIPPAWAPWKLTFAIGVVLLLTLLNIRGVRESVAPLVPIFLVFVLTHVFTVGYSVATHATDLGQLASSTVAEARQSSSQLGWWAMLLLIMHSYSMGAGTYTGIEAVSNGMGMLRQPRVQTAKRTMTYMWVSLAVLAVGLMVSYLLLAVQPQEGKTVNAVLLERMTAGWTSHGRTFVIVTLVSEAVILCIAAQTGFLGGPRVLANMALDNWLPKRLSLLSDRLVTQNGVLLMSSAAIVTMLATGGQVRVLVVLYSINVFITFVLSQSGMVRHWWQVRASGKSGRWRHGLIINGSGLLLTSLILVWVTAAKFFEGGWVTLAVTAVLVAGVSLVRRYFDQTLKRVNKLNRIAKSALALSIQKAAGQGPTEPAEMQCDTLAQTAVLLVSGYNGVGLHTVMNVIRYFGNSFKNFVFLRVGVIDAGRFKGINEVKRLEDHIRKDTAHYLEVMRREGYYAEEICIVGTDVADEVARVAPQIVKRFPNCVFFAGQLIFPQDSALTRLLDNNIVLGVQKRLYREGIPFVILPLRV